MPGWSETYRGSVPPWECDVTEHFTIAYYFDRLAESATTLADILGLGGRLRAGGFGRSFDVRFVRELRAGSSFHIEGAALDLEDGLRLGYRVVDSANGETVTWVEERWDPSGAPLSAEMRAAIAGQVAVWPGPAIEPRPQPLRTDGLVATARGRVKPADLDANGRFGLGPVVHRFTDSSLQAGAAIGMTAEFMEANRRGFSTFELSLRLSGALSLDDPYLIETGIAHLGSSSLRYVHRMCDPRSGEEIARLGQFGVNLDLDARRPARLPEELRAKAARLVVPVA